MSRHQELEKRSHTKNCGNSWLYSECWRVWRHSYIGAPTTTLSLLGFYWIVLVKRREFETHQFWFGWKEGFAAELVSFWNCFHFAPLHLAWLHELNLRRQENTILCICMQLKTARPCTQTPNLMCKMYRSVPRDLFCPIQHSAMATAAKWRFQPYRLQITDRGQEIVLTYKINWYGYCRPVPQVTVESQHRRQNFSKRLLHLASIRWARAKRLSRKDNGQETTPTEGITREEKMGIPFWSMGTWPPIVNTWYIWHNSTSSN